MPKKIYITLLFTVALVGFLILSPTSLSVQRCYAEDAYGPADFVGDWLHTNYLGNTKCTAFEDAGAGALNYVNGGVAAGTYALETHNGFQYLVKNPATGPVNYPCWVWRVIDETRLENECNYGDFYSPMPSRCTYCYGDRDTSSSFSTATRDDSCEGDPDPCPPQGGSVSTRDGCASIMEIEAGTVYMSYQRVGECDVDEEGIRFYLNSDDCSALTRCPDEPAAGSSCQYMEDEIDDCEAVEPCGEEGQPACPSFCVDPADVRQVLCMEPDSPCQDCVDVDTGSPTCMKYTTASGTRIKSCFKPDGTTCSWKKCCKLKLSTANCGW